MSGRVVYTPASADSLSAAAWTSPLKHGFTMQTALGWVTATGSCGSERLGRQLLFWGYAAPRELWNRDGLRVLSAPDRTELTTAVVVLPSPAREAAALYGACPDPRRTTAPRGLRDRD